MELTRRGRYGLTPLLFVSNILIWISAVIVMGILSYFISTNNNQGSHIIYEEVIVCSYRSRCCFTPLTLSRQSVLTVVFFLLAFFIGAYPDHLLIFNLVFSYLWIVAVAFTASDFTYSNSALAETVEAFSFIALYVNLISYTQDLFTNLRSASACYSTSFTNGILATMVSVLLREFDVSNYTQPYNIFDDIFRSFRLFSDQSLFLDVNYNTN